MVFDHLGFNVKDFAASRAFYLKALAPLDITVILEDDKSAMIGRKNEGAFWFGAYGAPSTPMQIAASSTRRRWPPGPRTTARRACARSTTLPTTARSSSTTMGTISKPCATRRNRRYAASGA